MPLLMSHGFRPFFLLAGFYAALSMALWIGALQGYWHLATPWPAIHWHAHEMLFGFIAAVIAGFLLTAVPQWTDTSRVQGTPLAILLLSWLLGRAAAWASPWLPSEVVAVCDLLFLPLLLFLVAIPIYTARRTRNYGIPVLLLLLFLGNVLVHFEFIGRTLATARQGLHLGVAAVVLLVAIIGGRVVPAFTRNTLRRRGDPSVVTTNPKIAALALVAMTCTFGLELLPALLQLQPAGLGRVVGVASMLTAGLLLARSWNWHISRTLDEPILCILHFGQAWLVIGFALKGIGLLTGTVLPSAALHTFTAGAIGTMSLAFMTRAALGHAGRPLVASPPIVLAYALVILGAVARVFPPIFWPSSYTFSIATGGLCWIVAYGIYTAVFWPILTRPRIDGRPG